MSTTNSSIQVNITNWLSFIHEFISKSINDIIILRTTTNPRFFTLPSSQLIKDKSISVLIYFVRRHVRFIVEIWTIKVSILPNQKSRQLNLIKANKKLQTLNRTLQSCLKMLPLFCVFKNKHFDFSFDTEIEVDTQQVIDSNTKQRLNFNNYSDSIGCVQLNISYLDKVELFKKEDSIKQSFIQSQIDYSTAKTTLKPSLFTPKDKDNGNDNGNANKSPNYSCGNANAVLNLKESNINNNNQCRKSSQTFSFSNSSTNENEPNNFEGLKKKSLIDCSLTPYSKEGTDLFWEKTEVRNVLNRFTRLNKYCFPIEDNEEDKHKGCNSYNGDNSSDDLFICDDIKSNSSSTDELELAYIDNDNYYLNEPMKPEKIAYTIHIDEITHKLALLKQKMNTKNKLSINTSMLIKKLFPNE